MNTNIFLSRPTKLPKPFEKSYSEFHAFLEGTESLSLRRLGSTDYSLDAPLQAIIHIMDECEGAIVLGYPHVEIFHHIRRSIAVTQEPTLLFPTPWNQIEGSLAYGAKLPVLVIAHPGIGGGIFDHGVTGQFVLTQDLSEKGWFRSRPFQQVYREWKSRIPKRTKPARAR